LPDILFLVVDSAHFFPSTQSLPKNVHVSVSFLSVAKQEKPPWQFQKLTSAKEQEDMFHPITTHAMWCEK